MSLVIGRKVGSPSRKAVLMVMADAANPDGSSVWVSKPNIARRSEVSEKTVKRAISQMLDEGLISIAGKKKISNGYTTIYDMNLDAIRALETTQNDGGQIDRGDTVSPDTGTECPPTPGHSDPQTVLNPSLNHPTGAHNPKSLLTERMPSISKAAGPSNISPFTDGQAVIRASRRDKQPIETILDALLAFYKSKPIAERDEGKRGRVVNVLNEGRYIPFIQTEPKNPPPEYEDPVARMDREEAEWRASLQDKQQGRAA